MDGRGGSTDAAAIEEAGGQAQPRRLLQRSPPLAGRVAPGGPDGVAGDPLPGGRWSSSWSPPSGRVDPLSGSVIKGLSFANFESIVNDPGLPRDRRAHDPHGRAGDDDRRGHRLPDRLLYGEGGEPPKTKATLVVAVLMPLWASYLVKVYAWRAMLSRRRGDQLGAETVRAARAGLRHHRGLAGDDLPLAAVHDPADLRRAGTYPGFADRRLRGPRRGIPSPPSGG